MALKSCNKIVLQLSSFLYLVKKEVLNPMLFGGILKYKGIVTSCAQQSHIPSITRLRRRVYPRSYMVRIVNPDGSSFTVRHPEPVGILRLPVNPDDLSEDEKRLRTKRLREEKAVKVVQFDDSDVKFDRRAALARFGKKKT